MASLSGHFLLDAGPRVGRFLVEGDQIVCIEPAPGADPAAIRLGIQAGDLAVRLRREAAAMEACLTELEASQQVSALIDTAKVRESWQTVLHSSNQASLHLAGSVIGRGLMAGLFLEQVRSSAIISEIG